MIAEFARTGKPNTPSKNKSSIGWIPSFSSDDNSFISITDKATTMKHFRFCEMGLWTGAVERLNSASCDILKVTTESIERLQTGTKKIVNIVSSPIDNIGNIGGKIIPQSVPNIYPVTGKKKDSINPFDVGPKNDNGVAKILSKVPKFGLFK